MTRSTTTDITLVCASCQDPFVFSAGEQQLQQLRGIRRAPERCPACLRRALAGPRRTHMEEHPS